MLGYEDFQRLNMKKYKFKCSYSSDISSILEKVDYLTLFVLMQVVLGTLLAALVPVVGFNAVVTSEHFASFLVCFSYIC